MGYNLTDDFKTSLCRSCGTKVECRHVTTTVRCPDCKYKEDQEKSKKDKIAARSMLWGY